MNFKSIFCLFLTVFLVFNSYNIKIKISIWRAVNMEENITGVIVSSVFVISVIAFVYFKFIKRFIDEKYK
jgi:hypothetical protein